MLRAHRLTAVSIAWIIGLAIAFGPAGRTSQAADPTIVVMFGDSLTWGTGLDDRETQALPVKLQDALRARGHDIEIRNAGIAGDTTAGGRERVDWSVTDEVDWVIVALGGNDALRPIAPEETRKNLTSIVEQIRLRNKNVVVAGMLAPPNLGPDYGDDFNAVFPEVAEAQEVPLYPFLLDGVAGVADLNQADGIHPNPQGVATIVERLAPFLEDIIFDKGGAEDSEIN